MRLLQFFLVSTLVFTALNSFYAAPKLIAQNVITFSIDMRGAIIQRWLDPLRENVGVRGSIAPLRWDSTLIAFDPDRDSIYTLTVPLSSGGKYTQLFGKRKLAYKFKIENSQRLGPNSWETVQNSTLLLTGKPQTVKRTFNVQSLAPTPPTRLASVRVHEFFQPKTLLQRTISVYVPPGYDNSTQRYPVLYLHDGQNIFDDATAASGEWYADEIAEMLIKSKKLPPCIIVGVSVRGEDRINEYTPVPMRRADGLGRADDIGGKGSMHAQMLAEEIKPFIDSTYRTLKDRANTAVGGSSLGGLISIYTAMTYPSVFGRVMAMSPSVWWSNSWILASIRQTIADSIPTSLKPAQCRIWVDIGDAEGVEAVAGARELKNLFIEKGWKLNANLGYMEAKNAPHSETAWSERLEPALSFMFGRVRR
ncbi:MAG: alpha/beta hydrolase-fold protein [Candidatus Kapabacteria bacterium]|nr:alpha/beta hydrolase-fold protein [Candidatus Kapabacteria bacterium]